MIRVMIVIVMAVVVSGMGGGRGYGPEGRVVGESVWGGGGVRVVPGRDAGGGGVVVSPLHTNHHKMLISLPNRG